MENYKKSVNVILVNSKKQILLHLRDNNPHILYPNYWACIGGGVEDGESELEALKREVKEEINISIENFQYLDKFYLRKHKIMVFFYIGRLDVSEEKIKLTEGQCVKFFDPAEIKNLKILGFLKKIIYKHLNEILSVADN